MPIHWKPFLAPSTLALKFAIKTPPGRRPGVVVRLSLRPGGSRNGRL
ncbi:hypothetical protein ACPA9J_31775 [Pseudomonas aeruginosa]